jgi:hypothetical protein
MKKSTLFILMMFIFAGLAKSQVIEDFEPVKMNVFSQGANGYMKMVPNPDPSGINTSANVVEFLRGKDGDAWAGFYTTLSTPVDITANRYVHVWVWKPRISRTVFKLERADGNFEVASMSAQTQINAWEELVFDFGATAASGEYVKIVFFPDFPDGPVGLEEDIVIYFDHIYVNNDPAVGSAPVMVIEDYENIPLNLMKGGEDDMSNFTKVENPDKSGANLSDYVIKFHRDKDGVPWGGWFSATQVDVTTNKYMHAKVWKPRISPIKFKLEGGAAGTLEIASMNAQTETGKWVDYVFDFSSKTGTYPTIVFMPDFADPVDLTEDIDIYFDDIILNNDPNPILEPTLLIGLDMTEATVAEGEKVWITGAFGGPYGTWNEPGTNPVNEMIDPDGDKIYHIWLHIPDGVVAFKFAIGSGWGKQDPLNQDRTYEKKGDAYVIFKWGQAGYTLGVDELPLADNIRMYPNPVFDQINIKHASHVQSVIITSSMGQVVGHYTMNNTSNQVIDVSSLSGGLYFITFVDENGKRQTQKFVKN